MDTVELGDTAKDAVTGYQGIVIARTLWINSCDRLLLQAPVDKDGKVPETYQVDFPNAILVKKKEAPVVVQRKTGGPTPKPQRHSAPTRA